MLDKGSGRFSFGVSVFGATLAFLVPGGPSPAATFTQIDVPGALLTYPSSITNDGTVAGSYEEDSEFHPIYGFIRTPDGTITTFTVKSSNQVVPFGINRKDATTGAYVDSNIVMHGYVRKANGRSKVFDPPGSTETDARDINRDGAITGWYINGNTHGFVRASDGTITNFDPEGSTGTYPFHIGSDNSLSGYYSDASGAAHGFIRDSLGSVTTIDFPGATQTFAIWKNPKSEVTGYYLDNNSVAHGFVRSAGGKYKSFDPQGSAGIGTISGWINRTGTITGIYSDGFGGTFHGFVRAPDGTITDFDPPNSTATFPQGINDDGVIVGEFGDNSGHVHGFIRTP